MCTLLIEAEAIVNSHPLTTDLLSDVNNIIPPGPINLLTLKSRVVMWLPAVFTAPEIYCHKHWRRVQHISNEFWSRWRKEVLATLQCLKKWNTIKKNWKVGDIVLLKETAAQRYSWPMAKIVVTNADKNWFVRSVKLMLGTSGTTDMALQHLEWPVNKLVMLVENDMCFEFDSTRGSHLWMIKKFQYVLTYQEESNVEGTLELRLDVVSGMYYS